MTSGRQAGLEGFLLGSTAGMLRVDAMVIAISAALTLALVLLLRRPLTLASFDPEFATSIGQNVRRTDLAMMGIVLAVTVVGLKIVGLILIVALLIIPPVTARFWTERADHVVILSGALGGNVAGKAIGGINQGTLINSLAGVVGGGLGGTILGMVTGAGAKASSCSR